MSTVADSFVDRRAPASQWRGTVLVLASAFAFSTAGLFTRLVETDVWTMLFWRGLFGGLLMVGYVVWRDGPLAMAALRRVGRPGLVAAGCSTAATICFINALRETSVLFAALLGTFLLREVFTLRRALGTATIVAGVMALRLA